MDVLSQLVTAMSVGRPRSYVIECHPPWGRDYAPVPGAGVHVVVEGEATLIRPDAPPLRLGLGDVVLLPTGIGHGLASSPEVPLISLDDQSTDEAAVGVRQGVVVLGPDGSAVDGPTARLLCGMYLFDTRREHPVLRRLPPVVHLPARLGEHSELSTVVAMLARELATSRVGSRLAVEALLNLLLITTLRSWYDQHPTQDWAAALSDPAVADALHHIHADPQHPWTVANLGDKVGLSRATFSKRFSQLVGRPPLSYLTWWRMTLAAKLLQDGDRSLADVARAVGYSSPYAFTAAFKREHGVAPGRYRQHSVLRSAAWNAHSAGR